MGERVREGRGEADEITGEGEATEGRCASAQSSEGSGDGCRVI